MAINAAQVSLADTNAHRLADLLAALTIPFQFNRGIQLDIQADSGNSGTVSVGDGNLSTSRYGRILAASAVMTLGPDDTDDVSTLDIYLLASAATQKVNIVLRQS